MDGRFVELNPAYERMLGYTAEDLIGKTVSCVNLPDDVQRSTDRFRDLVSGKRNYYDREKRIVRKDGSVIWVRLRTSLLRGDDGSPEYAYTMVEDITAAKQAREELRASERRFRALVERLPVGICIVKDGRILFRNPRLEMLFGPVREGLEFRRWMDIHPEDAGPFGDLCEALDSGVLRPTETDLRFYPSGKAAEGVGARWVHLRATPIYHEGKPAALLSMLDVTRSKELEHLVRVREKMSALGHVATGIAHEIRNPLSGINIYLSNLELLFGQPDGLESAEREKITQIVGKLRSASERIASVIHKVMEFSKPAPPRMNRVNLNSAVEEAVRLSVTELRKHDVRIEKCLAPDLPPCTADHRLIEQVVLNLINNASQAMEGIECPRRLEVASFRDRAHVVVRVSDSGPGIPLELRSKIFDPFFTTRKEGYGIGLSFSHRIVADHGGLLSVGTSRWGGAEFRMEIPFEEEEDDRKTASPGDQVISLENPGPPVGAK
jgi:PAS domain S-box-containing protein